MGAVLLWIAITAASVDAASPEPQLNAPLGVAFTGLMAIVTTGLGGTAAAVMYYRLRSVKESLDLDQIASVFD
jgi:hypothetical protein